MIATLKNSAELVYAYADYALVDRDGKLDDFGEYCFIHDFWIHSDYRAGIGLIKKFLIKYRHKHPQVRYLYWTRGKYDDRKSQYSIRRILNGRWRRTTELSSTPCSVCN